MPLSGQYAVQCTGAIQGKEGGIQVLAGLTPSSQTVGSLFRVTHEQVNSSSLTTEVNIAPVTPFSYSFLSRSATGWWI